MGSLSFLGGDLEKYTEAETTWKRADANARTEMLRHALKGKRDAEGKTEHMAPTHRAFLDSATPEEVKAAEASLHTRVTDVLENL